MGLLRFQYRINWIPKLGAVIAVANPELEVRPSVGVILRQCVPSVGPDLRIRIRQCLIDPFHFNPRSPQTNARTVPDIMSRLPCTSIRLTIIKLKSSLFPPRQIGRIVNLIAHSIYL